MLLVIASFALLVFAFAGCGGDDNSSADTTTTETTTEDTETTETETTETETTTEDTDTDTTSALGDFATAENCQEFEQISAKLSSALTGTGGESLEDTKQYLDDLVDAAPDEIKADFQTIAGAYAKVVDAYGSYDPTSGQPPPADVAAKLAQLSSSLDQAKLTQAGTNISTWAQENC
jgi:hypothetical protein